MFKRVSGPASSQNVTITIKQTRARSSLYFVMPPDTNVIHTRRDVNSAIKLAHSFRTLINDNLREILVRDDANAWPKNYPPLR